MQQFAIVPLASIFHYHTRSTKVFIRPKAFGVPQCRLTCTLGHVLSYSNESTGNQYRHSKTYGCRDFSIRYPWSTSRRMLSKINIFPGIRMYYFFYLLPAGQIKGYGC